MTHSAFTGVELDGLYIEVEGHYSERELLDVLHLLVGPVTVARPARCPPLLTFDDGRTIMYVDVGSVPGASATLAIGNLDHDDGARERAAEGICRALVSGTPWRLCCSAEDGEDGPGMRWAC
jgi:hypothetical protein